MAADKKKKAASGGKVNKERALDPMRWLPLAPERRGVIGVIAGALVLLVAVGVASSMGLFDSKRAASGSELRIEEVMSSNGGALITESGEAPDWIRITNTGSEAIDLRHYGLLVEEDPTDLYSFPAVKLGGGESLTVLANNSATGGKDGLEAPFSLSASGGQTLVLFDAGGSLIDSVALPELEINQSYRRVGDEWEIAGAAASGGVSVTPGALELSEVMCSNTLYFPDTDGACYDYAELRNISNSNVNLEGWTLSDSAEKLGKWTFPAVTLAPGGGITVHCSGRDEKTDPGHLHTNFSLSAGETLYLSAPDGTTVSAVTLPELLETNAAYSYVDGAWTSDLAPTPNASNTTDGAQSVREGLFTSKLCISEIMASATEQDCDWMEIYNGTGAAVNLGGYGLSDDAAKPRKWQFPDGTHIAPGEYMIVCCAAVPNETIGGYKNTGFALGLDGGYTVSLCEPDGHVIDAFYVPRQYGGVGYGRADGGRGLYFFEKGTPGGSNGSSGYVGKAPKAVPDVKGGLHKSGESFTVTLSAPEGARICYTTDCTDPTTSSQQYSGPITISSTTILRTRVYMNGYLPSYTDTQSYIYDAKTQDGVYIISLVSDPDNLSGDRGIMVRGNGDTPNYMQDWEREAHVEFFTSDGERVIGQGVDIGLHGVDTRKSPVKSINVKASGAYGDSRLRYPIFSERDYQDYSSVLLRPSGEDYQMSFMRDTLLSSLMKDTNLLYQKWELGVCYLNGQYYSLYYVRERITPDSICQFHGWTGLEDSVDVLIGNADSVRHGSSSDFRELYKNVKSMDMSTSTAYAYLDEHIDIDNYINYMAIELFSGNTDTLNRRLYRCSKADGKWRWALYDLDWAFFTDYDSIGKWLTPGGAGVQNATDNTLFIACMKNPTFRDKFLTRFGELLAGPFSTENVLARIDEREELLSNLLPDYSAMWSIPMKSLSNGADKLREYAKERPKKIIGYFRDAMKLSDADLQTYFGEAIQQIQGK